MESKVGRLRLAELTSSLGALVLGLGLGALFSEWLAGYGVWVLITGAVVHAWGMYDKNQLERRTDVPEIWWHVYAYWGCWLLLALGGLLFTLRWAV
jgi:uncharacterized membrane protein YecN with MAPEG domain